jgi:hypothetical protein
MRILNPIISGAVSSIKSIKGILAIWISTLLLVALVVLPMKTSIISALGRSMVTEKLKDGINMDVFTDLGTNMTTILSGFTTGFFLIILFGILLNVFFNGGLFSTLRSSEEKYSSSKFFRGSGINFWPFLLITGIISLIILILSVVIFVVAFGIAGSSDTSPEGTRLRAGIISAIIVIAILPIFLLVADYARVWQVTSSKSSGFKAIGVGFKQTFKYFFSSYPVMFINMAVQLLFSWFMVKFILGMGPQTGGGIFLLFLFSQCLFIIKILLRVWRYGSVTTMYEKHPE